MHWGKPHGMTLGYLLGALLAISDFDNRPDTEFWEDWMWEVSTWFAKMGSYDMELIAYRLLHRLQGRYIPHLLGVVRLCITSEFSPLHPIIDIVQGLILEYIPGITMVHGEAPTGYRRLRTRSREDIQRHDGSAPCHQGRELFCYTMISTPGMSFCGRGLVSHHRLWRGQHQTVDSLELSMKIGEGSLMEVWICVKCRGSWWIPRVDVGRGW